MGESSACLMRSFSHPSPTSQDSQEGDPLRRALTSSVSFGRFISESLAWEKWSSFTQNRYLEEVEKYSKPGSVAEKKAYFEAHFNRKAAQKVAASVEQQNAAVNESSTEMAQGQERRLIAIEEVQVELNPISDLNLSVDESGRSSLEGYKIESDQIEGKDQGIEEPTSEEKPVGSSILHEYDQSPLEGCRIESDQIEGIELGTELPTSVENQVESSILPEYGQSPTIESKIQNAQIEGSEQDIEHPMFVQKHVKSSILLEDAQCIINQQEVKVPDQDAATVEVSAFSDKRKPASSSAKKLGHRQESRLHPPLKPATPMQPKKGDQGTSYSKSTGRESAEKKRSTPKSLHMSLNFGSCVGNTNKTSSQELQKIVNSRLVRNLRRTTKESTKQQTPTRASTNGVSVTPQPATGRTKKVLNHPIYESMTSDCKSQSLYIRTKKVLNHPICGSMTSDRKSESLHMRSSISSTKGTVKAQYPVVSASFNLRTEERAAKRKENLRQKMSMEAAEKEQLQARLKWRTQNEAKDVRQSTVSQGKTNASFQQGIKPLHVQMKKITRTQPCSPGIEKKQESEVLHNNSRPTWRHSVKADSFKDLRKNHPPPTYSTKLFPQKNSTNENTSPNIQV